MFSYPYIYPLSYRRNVAGQIGGVKFRVRTQTPSESYFTKILLLPLENYLRYCIPGYSSFKIETGFFPSSSIQSSKSQWALGLDKVK